MRYRFVFIAGVGVGFVLGARAGRERYEQLSALARKAADSPAVQQAAGALQAQAADFARTTRQKVTQRMPKMSSARSKIGAVLHDRGSRASHPNGHPTGPASATGPSEPTGDGHAPTSADG